MKKYLMGGIAAVAICAAFTSCSKSNELFDQNAAEQAKQQTKEQMVVDSYEKAFVNAFGKPADNQDWGFASRQLPASFGAKTRTAQTNGNQWEDMGYTIPADITESELAAVLNVFNKKGEASYTSLIDWDEYFVQQVYKGDASYYNHSQYVDNDVSKGLKPNEQANVVGSQHMDWLCTVTNKHVNVVCYWPYEEEIVIGEPYDDHINNFNNGNAGGNWTSEKSGKPVKQMMLMQNTNSNVFGFKSSEDNGHVFYNFRMEEINGNYYVGFDFEANGNNPNEKVDRDYIYNDWIVKIVPGKGTTPEPKTYSVRVICEDLMVNNATDFDFNDIVFDVNYTENVNKTFITIKAAGGTIPLYIQGKEVHKLFQDAYPEAGIVLPSDGVLGTMINTNATGGVEVGDVTLELDGIIAPKDIEITVNANGTVIPLKAETGQPAAKIAVDPSFDWLNERDNITQVCPNFPTYVKNGEINWY